MPIVKVLMCRSYWALDAAVHTCDVETKWKLKLSQLTAQLTAVTMVEQAVHVHKTVCHYNCGILQLYHGHFHPGMQKIIIIDELTIQVATCTCIVMLISTAL